MRKRLLYQFLIINILTGLAGALFLIQNWPGANMLIVVSIIMQIMFAIPAIMEVYQSKTIDMAEKLVWTIGLIFATSLAGLIYLAFRRNIILGYKRK